MSVSGAGSVLANAFALSIPGTFVTIIDPGEKPSARFQSVGSIGRGGDKDADRMLLVRPARNFLEGHRYVVALRNLRDANGKLLKAPAGFRIFRDKQRSKQGFVNKRRGHMESLFKTLGKAGIARKNLYAAWDFTISSERSLSERMLHIRNDAFATLGDKNLADQKVTGVAPHFDVTKVTDFTRCTAAENGMLQTNGALSTLPGVRVGRPFLSNVNFAPGGQPGWSR